MAMIVGMQYRPVLDLDFGRMKSLTAVVGPTPSFTRASTGTYFNSSGMLTTAAINGPRFDHVYNGSSWVSKGLLIEEARTNSLIQSGDISNAAYTKSFLTAPVSAVLSPDGSTYANALTEDTTTNIHRFYRNTTAAAGKTVTFSIFLKAGTARYAVVHHSDNFDFRSFCVADLQTGTITNSGVVYAATGASYIGSTITNCENGWYRVSLTGTNLNTDGNYYTQVGISNSSTSTGFPSYLGSGQIIYAFGLQLEFDSAFPTSYIPTTTAAVTRSADVCQITGGDFTSFWNASEGSFAVEFDRLAVVDAGWSGGYPRTVSVINSADGSRVINIFGSQSPAGEAFYVQDGTLQAWFSAGAFVVANTTGKFSAAYKINDFAASLNGAAVATDTSGVIPSTLNMMTIGNETGVARYINGHIARLRYFNTRLTNATLRLFSGGSGAFQPDNISGLQFWVDASDAATLYTDSTLTTLAVADGDVVGGWKDKSSNSRNALQTDGTKKPLLKLAIQNGRNVVRFDGVNDNMTFSTWQSNPATVFLVVRSSNDTVFLSTLAAASPSYPLFFYYANGNIYGQDGYFSGFSTANTYNQWTVTCSTTARTIRRDGTAGTSAGGVATVAQYSKIGEYDTSPTYSQTGDTLEILGYNSVLSGSDILLVEAYLKAKWGTP